MLNILKEILNQFQLASNAFWTQKAGPKKPL